ncbi:MAG TPA: Uxx-star family glutaredoxin-like (seleno)protein [Methanoregulaceae archaeon]|nr:Uxx-star family glutaredoxin-like (seleno)protein [Methanoregulaceae archaeon]
MPKVTVYSTKNCPYCRMAKAFLEKHGVPYTSIDVGEDTDQAEKMIEMSGQRGVPVIVVDDEVIIGFDAQRLNELFGSEEPGDVFDVLIIGAGPAGLTAAVYCARKSLRAKIISENIGGQALESWAIENYMGYRMITGDELMKKFEEQVREQNISLDLDRVRETSLSDEIFTIRTVSGVEYRAYSLILCQGMKPRKLGVEGEEKFLGRGLSICATCDGPLYRNKDVAVVGGGNSALSTAIEMSKITKKVHLIVRSTIKADSVYVKLYKEQKNIEVHPDSVITAIHGDKFLSGISIRNKKTGVDTTLVLDGVFAEIGWVPNTDFVKGLIDLNGNGEIIVDINCHTNVPGAFAAGDVTNIKGKQIIIASGEGAKAALEAQEFLMKER